MKRNYLVCHDAACEGFSVDCKRGGAIGVDLSRVSLEKMGEIRVGNSLLYSDKTVKGMHLFYRE